MAEKLFYSMGEVAELFDVKPSLLRHWESQFPVLRPKRNKKGNRLFSPQDVATLKLIYHLVKERGMTLEGAKKALRQQRADKGMTRDAELMERLQRIRALLVEVREDLKAGKGEILADSDPEEAVADDTALVGQPGGPVGSVGSVGPVGSAGSTGFANPAGSADPVCSADPVGSASEDFPGHADFFAAGASVPDAGSVASDAVPSVPDLSVPEGGASAPEAGASVPETGEAVSAAGPSASEAGVSVSDTSAHEAGASVSDPVPTENSVPPLPAEGAKIVSRRAKPVVKFPDEPQDGAGSDAEGADAAKNIPRAARKPRRTKKEEAEHKELFAFYEQSLF